MALVIRPSMVPSQYIGHETAHGQFFLHAGHVVSLHGPMHWKDVSFACV